MSLKKDNVEVENGKFYYFGQRPLTIRVPIGASEVMRRNGVSVEAAFKQAFDAGLARREYIPPYQFRYSISTIGIDHHVYVNLLERLYLPERNADMIGLLAGVSLAKHFNVVIPPVSGKMVQPQHEQELKRYAKIDTEISSVIRRRSK